MSRPFRFFLLLFSITVCLPARTDAQINLSQGLVGYFPFSGNADDASGNSINGSASNVSLTSDRNGTPNSAYLFNGSNSSILLPYSDLYNFPATGAHSISVWIQPDLNAGWPVQALVVKSPPHANYQQSLWNYGTYLLNYEAMAGYAFNSVVVGTTTLNTGPCWYNIIYTYDNGIWKLYVNGVQEAADLTQTRFILQDGAASQIAFGKKGQSDGDYFKGKMDDVRIYDRVLTADEIGVLSQQTSPCLPDCSNWLNLPSVQSFVSVGDLDVPGDKITVEAVFTRTAPYTGGLLWAGDLVSKHNSPSDANYLLRPNNAEITTTNGYFRTPDICDIQLNKTYHAAMVYDGSTLNFYRNGFLMSSVAASGDLYQNNFLTKIGIYDALINNTQLIGYINEVRIWNVARTQAQINAYLTGSLPNPAAQPGLLAYYTFDNLLNKQGTPAWNGTLGGAASINQANPNCALTVDSCETIPPDIVVAGFEIPDTICVNTSFTINNTSVNASSYYWDFCQGNINQTPAGNNLGNIGGAFSAPVFMDYVFVNGNYYGFSTNYAPGKLLRLNFGNSLLNNPTATDLGNFGGVIPLLTEGIQIVQNEGKWYAIIVAGYAPGGSTPRILKVDFGANIANNTPTATNWGNIGNLSQPIDLHVFQENGNWYGFTVNAENNTITRFNFTGSFDNTPTAINLGNVGNLAYPTGIYAINDNGFWRVFIVNAGNNTRTSGTFSLSRLDFGNSLLNTPTGVNLGNPGGFLKHPRDLTILKFCGEIVGFAVNGLIGSDDIVKIDFNNNLSSVPSMSSLGNVGNLNFPHSIAKIFRVGADLYTFVTNVGNNTMTRLKFTGCSNSSIPNSQSQNPPAVSYDMPGTYSINLTIDDGLPSQASICRQVVVSPCTDSVIVNFYAEALSFDICRNTVEVEDASEFGPGDTVLVIQMKGALIDSSNTGSFGTVIEPRGSGNFEFNLIDNVSGNQITLKNRLLNSYDFNAGKVQLVRVPYFQNYVASKRITCLPWDGKKGGIIAFNVADTLRLEAEIDASGRGFRGGLYEMQISDCGEIGYYYDQSSTKGAWKGEGISTVGSDKQKGRGKLANGGGGGNDHNAGGGGGGSFGIGGNGGKEFAGLNGCVQQNNGGLAGAALSYNQGENRIFMGGGGGAGDINDISGGGGGANGGGIIVISANFLSGTNGKILSMGDDATNCQSGDCWNGFGGGGGGGAVLLSINNYLTPFTVNTSGGNGGNLENANPAGYNGPGGGGGGGLLWLTGTSIPPMGNHTSNGGLKGVHLPTNADGGSSDGSPGGTFFSLQLPIDNIPFKPNIDSVRIKDSATGCASFAFKGLAYTNTYSLASWHWTFGDGASANTQDASHTYLSSGNFTVKLVVTDVNGCKDSISRDLSAVDIRLDFDYEFNACDPLSVSFNGAGTAFVNPYWSFGDGNLSMGQISASNTYSSFGNYVVKYSAGNGTCSDTVTKTITIAVIDDHTVVTTADTTICYGTSKQLRTTGSLSFCWSPVTYLDDPASPQPVSSSPVDITYYHTAEVTGANLIVNGDFSQGNNGFNSDYILNTVSGVNQGVYNVSNNILAWHPGMIGCDDHGGGSGNMLMVNGATQTGVNVWSQAVAVQPNTNYAFSTWLQHITTVNPAQLQFSINGIPIGHLFQANSTPCTWEQFYTKWNSGNATTAVISIINQNQAAGGNDFALDDISFSTVLIKRDSVRILVDKPLVKTVEDTARCEGLPVQLSATGAQSYSWQPASGLSDPNAPNPVASPSATTEYIVTGINSNGCEGKDTLVFTVYPAPVVTVTPADTICRNGSIQLSATGGSGYSWTPASLVDDPTSPTPVASPSSNTLFHVTVLSDEGCIKDDSVMISIFPDPVFLINAPLPICENDSARLIASGGDRYEWQPEPSLSDLTVSNPIAKPVSTTDYTVTITENNCNRSAILTTTVIVNPSPTVRANKSNDIDCSNDRSQLTATGATSYQWTPALSLSDANVANPIARPVSSTQYVVKGTDVNGCAGYDTVSVDFLAINNGGYLMPNAFTPNEDGLNDCFGIKYWGIIQELEFSVYNRWGERLFYSKDPNACWNGTYKGAAQDVGVYVYIIRARTLCGDTFKKGTFVLSR